MSSLLTNVSAMAALRAMAATQRALVNTETQVSTGLRVATASDNAAYWSISTSMKARTAGLGAVQDSLNLTKSIADVSYAAVNSVIGQVQQIQKDVVSAEQPHIDKTAVQSDIAARQNSIRSTIKSASFNGVNWLRSANDYTVTETVSHVNSESLSKAAYDRMTVGTTWTETRALQDDVSVIDPYGLASTYHYDQPAESITYSSTPRGVVGSSVQHAQANMSESINSSQIGGVAMPFGIAEQGTSMEGIAIGNFALLANVTATSISTEATAYSDQTTNTSSSYNLLGTVGTSIAFAGDTNPGQAFLLSVLPASPLTSLLSLDLTSAAATTATNEETVRQALAAATSVAGQIGSLMTRIGIQAEFNAALSDALTSGYGSLVDADMNVASTRLQALQTQQQLGIQALSIANDNAKEVLKLFG